MNEGKLSDCGTVRVLMSDSETGRPYWSDLPCKWKDAGLAVVEVTRIGVSVGGDVQWPMPGQSAWGVTHLASGRNIGPRQRTAANALAVALGLTQLGIDWTQDMEKVRAQVEANETAASFIFALHHGRVAMVEAAKA